MKTDWRTYAVHDEANVKGFFGEYRFLSNFHEAQVFMDGHAYPSTENAYQAAKTDVMYLRLPFMVCTPAEAKAEGGKVPLRRGWDSVKVDVMAAVLFDKFLRHPELRQALLDTGEKYLEETNAWNDRFWGVCNGQGQNELGKLLMRVRSFWANSDNPAGLF